MCLFLEFLLDIWPVILFIIFIFIIMPLLMLWVLPEKSPSSSMFKIRNDPMDHICKNCHKKFVFYVRDLYQQYGNCGGYESELFVDCFHCDATNPVYTLIIDKTPKDTKNHTLSEEN